MLPKKKAPSSGAAVHIGIRKVLRSLPAQEVVELGLAKLVWPPPSPKEHFLTLKVSEISLEVNPVYL